MRAIAIIPARGGSKRIPRKNIRTFRGKPIIAYSIEAAINAKLFDYIMVSTDDSEIAQVAISCGAQVPFLRSESNSNDHATTADVLLEVLTKIQVEKELFNYVCCIYPTAPFITVQNLSLAFNTMIEGKFDSVFPVCDFGFPIQRALTIGENNAVSMIWPENMNKRSQDLAKAYHDAGQFYWLNVEKFLKHKAVYSQNTGAITLDAMYVQDIDNEMDWQIAELKHSISFT
ncbi:MAG: pseudaminic acid cytidylyltransferase [Chitinophagaceae bacterium]|nr:MAG: pseudaminic acid cytidylyltransferase [Chitinophagaceae bacterium]